MAGMAGPASEPAIRIRGLSKRFGELRAVDDLTLDVPAGSIFGFLGANGAGKTTTLRMLAGLARPTAGKIEIAGVSSEAGPEYRRSIGYLSQEPAFYPWMSGRDVVRYVAGFHPKLGRSAGDRVEWLLERVGLADAAGRRARDYSGGMRRRLGIAAALVGDPTVLLLDEPAAGLDPIGRREVLELLESFRGATTVFYSTHILDDVQRVSDRLAVLDHGRLVTTAATDELLRSFTENRLRVDLVGATAETAARLGAIAGVTGVTVEDAPPGRCVFIVQLAHGSEAAVQAAITALAAAEGYGVAESRPIVLDLEEVFVRLVGKQEVAA